MQFSHRVIGCFKALATGDAIGKQTETLSRADVQLQAGLQSVECAERLGINKEVGPRTSRDDFERSVSIEIPFVGGYYGISGASPAILPPTDPAASSRRARR
jgi:hypothetical protein